MVGRSTLGQPLLRPLALGRSMLGQPLLRPSALGWSALAPQMLGQPVLRPLALGQPPPGWREIIRKARGRRPPPGFAGHACTWRDAT